MRIQPFVLALILGLLSAASASAQDGLPTAYEFRIYAAGATAPQVTTPVPVASVTCNLTRVTPPTAPVTNPTTVLWNDPVNVGKDCQWVIGATAGPLVALPSGTFSGALVASNAEGASAESAHVPFSRQRAPGALTGVRFTR